MNLSFIDPRSRVLKQVWLVCNLVVMCVQAVSHRALGDLCVCVRWIMGKLNINQPVVWCSCTCQIWYSHSYKNSTPCGQPSGGDRAPRRGAWWACSTHVWVSKRGAVIVGSGPLNGLVSPGRERSDYSTSQNTSQLSGLVNFLKSLIAVASSVGRELGAHSGLRRMET